MSPGSNIVASTTNVGMGQHSHYARPTWEAGAVQIVFDAELWLWDARRADTWVFVSRPVRRAQGLDVGDLASVTVELIDLAQQAPVTGN